MATAKKRWSKRTVDNVEQAVGGSLTVTWMTDLRYRSGLLPISECFRRTPPEAGRWASTPDRGTGMWIPRRNAPRRQIEQAQLVATAYVSKAGAGIVASVFTRLAEIEWSSMSHAYGTAEEVPDLLVAMASDDEQVRDKAFSRFYGAVHHQGDVYACTMAAVPFLIELAEAEYSPARAAFVRLLASISASCLDHSGVYHTVGGELFNYSEASATMASHSPLFERFTTDPDPQVRLVAIPAVAHFPTDPARTAMFLQSRLDAEVDVLQRLALVVLPRETSDGVLVSSGEGELIMFACRESGGFVVGDSVLDAVVETAE